MQKLLINELPQATMIFVEHHHESNNNAEFYDGEKVDFAMFPPSNEQIVDDEKQDEERDEGLRRRNVGRGR